MTWLKGLGKMRACLWGKNNDENDDDGDDGRGGGGRGGGAGGRQMLADTLSLCGGLDVTAAGWNERPQGQHDAALASLVGQPGEALKAVRLPRVEIARVLSWGRYATREAMGVKVPERR